MDIVQTGSWGFGEGPLIIAGPCSAESEEQLMATAVALRATGRVHLFRAGLWKPRSRPSSFAGEGERALEWLRRVKAETGLPVTVEVASPEHAAACLEAGIDAVWLGARTVSNPFSVDAIVSAMQGTDIPVMVKNPLSPDLELWIGAIERVYSAGIRKIAAIHRGFTPYDKSRYRNLPKWELAIELRSRIPSLPVICDPSHMSGKAALVPETAQKALDMNMAGLMVEVHHDPSHALSDKEQQLDPEGFERMMGQLLFRKSTSGDSGFMNHLEELRNRIDSIDHQLIGLLASRMRISQEMGEFKCRNGVTVFQLERWLEILQSRTQHGITEGLDREFVGRVIRIIHEESIRCQDEVMKGLRSSGGCPPAGSKGEQQ
ncbi:3-deoxy-7-phosphoheptulonate synthase [bacterium]|nr:3-deoxy-7-phosphoheptulonate synthase [bacterium]